MLSVRIINHSRSQRTAGRSPVNQLNGISSGRYTNLEDNSVYSIQNGRGRRHREWDGRVIEGPSVIETITNRFYGHFEGDPGLIRSKEELDYVKEHKDPLKIFREKVKGKIAEATLDAIDVESKANVDAAVAKARAANYPELSQLLTDVYVSY